MSLILCISVLYTETIINIGNLIWKVNCVCVMASIQQYLPSSTVQILIPQKVGRERWKASMVSGRSFWRGSLPLKNL